MKLDTKTKLTLLLQHYQQTRGAGHTHALFDGLKPDIRLDGQDRDKVVVMASDLNTAGRLFPFLYPKQWTSWNSFDEREAFRLRSRQHPLVLDNSAVIDILRDALDYIGELEHQIGLLRTGKGT